MLETQPHSPLSTSRIIKVWWPLAASWLLMGAELPAISAVIARLPYPEINLAAYGGIVFPLALIIEAPIIMLLAASTALSKDLDSYRKIWKFMMVSGASLTLLHILIAVTPLYYFITRNILGAPEVIIEPAHIGFIIMVPWTWSIAYRRFNQGVLIRFNHSKLVGIGTVIRLAVDFIVLGIGYMIGTIPGIVVATSAVAASVICEAIFAGIVTRPVVKNELTIAPQTKPVLTRKSFLDFYVPLALTQLLFLIVQPMGSAAISRMPNAIISLAVWPVVNGLIFMLRSLGVAYNEVVVALLDEPKSYHSLRRFALYLILLMTSILLLIAATPLSTFWFHTVSGLNMVLTQVATIGLWISILMPTLSVLQSWFQGIILHSRHTRIITEAVILFLITSIFLLILGVVWGEVIGLYVSLAVFVIANAVQTLWLWWRSSRSRKQIQEAELVQQSIITMETSSQ